MTDKKNVAVKAPTQPKVAPKAQAPKSKAKPRIQAGSPLAHGVGRRKKSVARIWLRRGSGKISVNGLPHMEYFDSNITRDAAATPFRICPVAANYDVVVRVVGGGKNGQADAVKLGIARAMVDMDENLRQVMRQHGLLTVDSRNKERKKYGQKAARRKFQFVKR
jgi:small subunit ribosomal protein S9